MGNHDYSVLCIATDFTIGADRNRFGTLLDKLQSDHLQGYDCYSKTLTSAFHLLVNWKPGNSFTGHGGMEYLSQQSTIVVALLRETL